LDVPNLDALLSSNNNPVSLGGKQDNVDGAINFSLGEELAVNEIPHNDLTVLASGGEVGSLGWHGERVNLCLVANEGILKSHGCVVPNLDCLIPRSRNDEGSLGILEELNCGNPVSVSALLNGEFALTNGVPDLEVLVSATAGNLSVVGGESNSENISRVADESLDCLTLL